MHGLFGKKRNGLATNDFIWKAKDKRFPSICATE